MHIWIPWVWGGPKSTSFQQAPSWCRCWRSVDHTRRCKSTVTGQGRRGGSNPILSTSAPLHVRWWTESGLIFHGSSSPQLHPSLPTQCTGNLCDSKQGRSLLINVLLQNWNGNKKRGWLCEHNSYWSISIITVSFKYKKKYTICCLSVD